MRAGMGAALMGSSSGSAPELVADMLRQARNRASVPISVKMRVHDDLRVTVELKNEAISAPLAKIHAPLD